MSRKWKERKEQAAAGKPAASAKPKSPETMEMLRRRRNKRFLLVGLVAIGLPILEVIAYQFRAITLTLVNRSNIVIAKAKVKYPGGDFELTGIKPGASVTRVIRPDFEFKGNRFSTYLMSIRYVPENGGSFHFYGPVGTIDYSAEESFTFAQVPPNGEMQLQHTSRPGFPLSLVRDLMERLGFG